MRRILMTALCVLGIVPAATAAELTAVGSTILPMVGPGDMVTIEFNFTNVSQDPINGLGISVYGYEGLDFVEGSAVDSYLNSICVAPGSCFGGLVNIVGGALAESSIGSAGSRVQVALSAQIGGLPNAGIGVDQGLDHQVGSAMFSLTFQVLGFGEIRVGTGYQGDGIILSDGSLNPIANELVYTFAPEPGTALLVGLGLAGLSASGKRRRFRG